MSLFDRFAKGIIKGVIKGAEAVKNGVRFIKGKTNKNKQTKMYNTEDKFKENQYTEQAEVQKTEFPETLENLKSKNNELSKQNEKLQVNNTQIEIQKAELNEKNIKLSKELKNLKSERDAIRKENTKSYTQLFNKIEKLQIKHTKLQVEKRELVDKVRVFKAEDKKLKKETKKSEKRLASTNEVLKTIFPQIEFREVALEVFFNQMDPKIIKRIKEIAWDKDTNCQKYHSSKIDNLWEYDYSKKGRIFVQRVNRKKPFIYLISPNHDYEEQLK